MTRPGRDTGDMSEDDMRERIAVVLAKTNGFEHAGPLEHEQASRVVATVAPLLAEKDAEIAEAWRRIAASQLDVLERGKEIARLRREVEFEANGERDFYRARFDPRPPCACPTTEQIAVLSPAFSRPSCAVHPGGGPLTCTCPSPLVSSAADCPSHGHDAMQGEFVSGWDFRCDTCRGRGHRHPRSGCHLTGCPCASQPARSVHPEGGGA